MATTKKPTTKAKTKTTKATTTTRAAKTTKAKATSKKSVAKATTKNTSSVKATAAKTQGKAAAKPAASKKVRFARFKKTRTPGTTSVPKLLSLQFMAVGVFLLLAVVAGVVMNSGSYQLTIGHMAKDTLTGNLAPAVQAIYDIEIRWAVVGILLLSVVLPLLYLTRFKNRYGDYVTKTRMQPWRWVDYAVTGALMTELVALISGASDIPTLKLIGGLVITTAVLGLISERQNNTALKPVRSAYYTSLFTGLLPWAFIAAYAVASVVYGAGAPWYVYAVYAAVLGGYGLMARNQHMEFRGANYLIVERNYIAINMLTKLAFAAILIAGLSRY